MLALLLASSFAAPSFPPPTIIQIIGDDCGYNDFGYQNGGRTRTPEIDSLVADGIELTSYHTYKVCAPSRASILTGRYPWGVGYYDMHGPEVVPVGFDMTPALLRKHGNYSTAMLGKWNLGHQLFPYTPTRRGFDSFFGYYAACLVDYWYHGAPANECGSNGPGDTVVDLSNSSSAAGIAPADFRALNGTYTQEMLTAEAERLIHEHGARYAAGGSAAARPPLYMYLAHHNVHGAVQTNSNFSLQAPAATVALYNTTALDTYKVAGAMLTELDEGVGRVVKALRDAGLYDNSVITFACDNGGPLDHSANAPLRGGKHTLWDGGLRASAWVHSPLLPASARGVQYDGLMHASDWLPTFVQGLAGVPNASAVATGPRPLDGFNFWDAWVGAGSAAAWSDSPRTEVVHQVVNGYCNGTAGQASVAPFGATIRVGRYKLISGKPGADDQVVPWPAPAAAPVPFGQGSGSHEAGTDHLRAGGVKFAPGHVECDPHCLFDVVSDPGEQHDLAADPAHASTVAALAARVAELGAGGPPWAWPLQGDVLKQVDADMCAAARTTGVFEPLVETPPPPTPPTPAPPTPPTPLPPTPAPGPPLQFRRNGACLGISANTSAAVRSGTRLAMTGCADISATWARNSVRGMPALVSAHFHGTDPRSGAEAPMCLHIGVDPSTMKCVTGASGGNSHIPHVRQCNVDQASGKGGNPVGCGFAFDGAAGTIAATSCVDEPNTCLGVVNGTMLAIVDCVHASAKGWAELRT